MSTKRPARNKLYRVKITFSIPTVHTMDDVTIRSASVKEAREDVAKKVEERWPNDKPTFEIERITASESQAIIDGGGIDWAS